MPTATMKAPNSIIIRSPVRLNVVSNPTKMNMRLKMAVPMKKHMASRHPDFSFF